jgi:hypothetical protein
VQRGGRRAVGAACRGAGKGAAAPIIGRSAGGGRKGNRAG